MKSLSPVLRYLDKGERHLGVARYWFLPEESAYPNPPVYTLPSASRGEGFRREARAESHVGYMRGAESKTQSRAGSRGDRGRPSPAGTVSLHVGPTPTPLCPQSDRTGEK